MGYISNSPWNHAKIISRIYWYPINNRESDLLLTYVIVYSPCIHHQSMFFFFFRNLNWRYTVIRPKCLGISDTKYGLKNGTLHLCFRVYSPSNPSSQWGNTSRKTWWVSKQTKIKMLGDFPRFTRFSTFSGDSPREFTNIFRIKSTSCWPASSACPSATRGSGRRVSSARRASSPAG